MTNRGTARKMRITISKTDPPLATREGKPIDMPHNERHPKDKDLVNPNKGINYGKGKAMKQSSWTTHEIKLDLAWSTIYNTLQINDVCPKCESKGKVGKIIWKGSTPHRPLHPRCNNGCLLIYTGEETIVDEEE